MVALVLQEIVKSFFDQLYHHSTYESRLVCYSQVQNKRRGDVHFFLDLCRPPSPPPFLNFSNFTRDYKEVHKYNIDG